LRRLAASLRRCAAGCGAERPWRTLAGGRMKTHVAGERFGFHEPSRSSPLPEEWRELDRAVWRWVLAHGGDPLTAHTAAWASHAEGQGHSALELATVAEGDDPDKVAHLRATLEQSALVAQGDAGDTEHCPFVLEGGHFYL